MATLPQSAGSAGRIDALNGDFVPAIEIDVPLALANLMESSDGLAIALLALMEQDLEAGKVALVPTTGVEFRQPTGSFT